MGVWIYGYIYVCMYRVRLHRCMDACGPGVLCIVFGEWYLGNVIWGIWGMRRLRVAGVSEERHLQQRHHLQARGLLQHQGSLGLRCALGGGY